VLAALALGCGGNVVVGSGGSGSGNGGSGSGNGGDGGGTTTPVTCFSHDECPGGVCIFSTGLCADACPDDFFETCPQGEICAECASSSCPKCNDCLAACVPAKDGACDDHDDCPESSVCLYGAQTCAPECLPSGGCEDSFLTCDDCATGSCPGCEDCVGACLEF
jgi:hypothetical protein